MAKPARTWVRVVAVALALSVVVALYLTWTWHRPLEPGTDPYVLKPGTSLRALARELHARDVIVEPYSFTWLGYAAGYSRRLKAGEYRFPPGINAAELLKQVVAGKVIEYPLVLVEGWNFRQVLQAVRAAPKLVQTLEPGTPERIMEQLGYPGVHPEGRFFPDTYYYSSGNTDAQLLRRAYERMQAVLREEWERRTEDLPVRSVDEALVLASIVEKETGQPDERGVIAGVFVNRLRKGMRLQSDPTVIYGLGDGFDGNIRFKDLRNDTPYNTYTRRGLPPTPIAMPGRDSIAAVLNPTPTSALYFVSRGDGSHVFSTTLAEHAAAVAKYQLGGRSGPRRRDPAGDRGS